MPGLFGIMQIKWLTRLRFENADYKVENDNYVNIINERNASNQTTLRVTRAAQLLVPSITWA